MSLHYSEVGKEDIETISRMAEQYLTRGYYNSTEIAEEMSRHNYYGMKAQDNGQIVGFVTYKEGIEFTLPHPALEQKIRSLTADGVMFDIETIFTNPSYRHQGIGVELMRRSLSAMRAMGVKYLLFECWVYPDGTSPALHLPGSDLPIIYEERLEHFYRDLPRYGMACPLCGENCQCGALIRLFSLT